MHEQLSDEERFYISQTSGYPTLHGNIYEHEYAVVDEATGVTVGLFMAERAHGNQRSFEHRKRTAHIRARALCTALNRRERGLDYDPGPLIRLREARL